MSGISAPSSAPPGRKRERFLPFARLDGVGRVWVLNVALVLVAAGIYLLFIREAPTLPAPFHLPWWILAALFFFAEVFVVHIQFRRDAHSVSLGEIPLVLGLFFTGPAGLVLAQVVGDALALAFHRRQSPVKLVFNVGHFALETCVAAALFSWVVSFGDPIGPAGWAATYVAVLASSVIGVIMIFSAISLSEGKPQYGILHQMLGTGTVVTIANASIALAIVTIAWINPAAAWVLLVPAVVFFVGYRAYTSISQRHEGLEFLYEAIRTFHRSPRPGEEAILELLSQTRRMFRAEIAEVIFLPSDDHEQMTRTSLGPEEQVAVMEPFEPDAQPDLVSRATSEGKSILAPRARHGHPGGATIRSRELRDAMIAPIPGQSGMVGALLIANRLGDISSFGAEDLRLLETLAQHLGVSLESARAGILEETVSQLTEINQMKDDLIASTSHELRTPLTSIQGFVKTLLRPDMSFTIDEQRSFLETVARQSERLNHLVEDLLMASRLESERSAIQPAPVSLAGIAHRIADEVGPQAEGRTLELEVDAATPSIETDGERVHQILLNLVVNAIKYSPDGSTITVTARPENDGLVLSVRDQGDGIPQDLHEKVFDRFYQVDQSSTRSAGGVGLGLYICRRLADTIGGRLWLQRSDERGSVFSLWIPRTPPSRATGVPEEHAAAG